MGRQSDTQRALTAIDRQGILLVYPIDNRPEPASLWKALHPRSEMRWAWDQDADDRVVALWHLRAELAHSRAVVYGKWFKGRAVFFSLPLFVAMLRVLRRRPAQLSLEAQDLLSALRQDSPQSTKRLRRELGLQGRMGERVWTRALGQLWEELAIVGMGEIDDGAFPSLALGATQVVFEEAWDAATRPHAEDAGLLERFLAPASPFGKHWQRVLARRAQRAHEPERGDALQ